MGRVTLGRARWRRDNILIAVHMRNHRHSLRPGLAAAGAGEGLHTGLGFRRLLRHFAVVPCVTQSVHISIHVAVTTGAGVRRVALFRAGRRRDDILVSVHMRKHRNNLRLGRTAARAGKGLEAGLGFGGGFRHHAIIPCMAKSRNLAGKGLAAVRFRAGARLRSRLGAGRLFFSCPFAEEMHDCIFAYGVIPLIKRNFLPYFLRSKETDILQVAATIKRVALHYRYCVRNCDAFQTLAINKCPLYNIRNAIWNGNTLKAFTSSESSGTDTGDVIRYINKFQLRAI